MSKYEKLWEAVAQKGESKLLYTYEEIQSVLGFPIDYSFLTYKKELLAYGYRVEKISMKQKTVAFCKKE